MRLRAAGVAASKMELDGRAKLFLLSPASANGVRALQLASPRASFAAAHRLRSADGLPIGEAFSFLSALYFRGKMAYARRFAIAIRPAAAAPEPALAAVASGPVAAAPERLAAAVPEPAADGGSILVIAPGFGLVPPDWPLTAARLRKLARTPVDPGRRAYSGPLRRDARELRERLPARGIVVLLGSIATGKYLDLLAPIFGDRLLFPRAFVGAGDMRRGSLLLRAARLGEELEYAGLESPRRTPRPPAASVCPGDP
jgi:hypothetical protein